MTISEKALLLCIILSVIFYIIGFYYGKGSGGDSK